eukprot:TRINITY_DN3751_c0_g1_i2.p1 TRINITY_DN3751_c0_g1~~TRINITY_DN3751_c0_g1_i2.p1  ORF type:complete len:665 (+),score=130.32 TRINITY_DN3751_c0_g1_i2:110-2104(+)
MYEWKTDEVIDWLNVIGLDKYVQVFQEEEIDGSALMDLEDQDLKEDLGMTLGARKTFLRERDGHVKTQKIIKERTVYKSWDNNPNPPLRLMKGHTLVGPGINEDMLHRIKYKRFSTDLAKWVYRDAPLEDNELDCWIEQSHWLICPITGKSWFDDKTALGVGLYHAPRFLSMEERARKIRYDQEATERNLLQNRSENLGTDNWSRDFEVYPTVEPPGYKLESLGRLPDNIDMGKVSVIIGPCFDISAYNDGAKGNFEAGIKPLKYRGVKSMEQQFNAVNFEYWVLRGINERGNSYARSYCTNRISFFIEDIHGSRVFPNNIESQLSLLLYRDKRIRQNKKTNYTLLAEAIRKVIPTILLSTIMEVVKGFSSALPDRLDQCIRTYLLIHQVAIKLMTYYETCFSMIYQSISKWIQNPFSKESEENWPDLEKLLIASSLVGIPWPVLREAFLRKLFYNMITESNTVRITSLYQQHSGLINNIMYELCFMLPGRSLRDLEKKYSRCAGSLPFEERETIKRSFLDVNVTSLQSFWLSVGMGSIIQSEYEITQEIKYFIRNIKENNHLWRSSTISGYIKLPSLNEVFSMNRNDLDLTVEEQLLEREREKHFGYPDPLSGGDLPFLVCSYPRCKKRFRHRDLLFAHLKHMIPPERMIYGHHQKHKGGGVI